MSFRWSFRSSAVMSGIGPAPPRSTRTVESACLASRRPRTRARGISTLLGADLCLLPPQFWGWRGMHARICRAPRRSPPGRQRPAVRGRRSAVAQERRDVDLVVGDLERRPLDARAAVAAAGRVARLLARGAGAGGAVVEAGGDHRHADLVAHVLVDDRAEDDVRGRVRGALDDLGRLVDLEQADVAAAGDVEQDAGRALDGLLEQRTRDRLLGRLGRAVLAARLADAHEGRAGVGHDRADVGEVQVDEAGDRDQVRDPLHALAQDVVGLAERLEDRRAALDDVEQLLVRDDDERVDDLAQPRDALVGLAHPLRALEVERLRDDAARERADLVLGDLRDDGRRAGAGAAALARRDEHHVRALQRLLDVVARTPSPPPSRPSLWSPRAWAAAPKPPSGLARARSPFVRSWPMLSLMSA